MYWARDTRIPQVADFMTRNRYQQIKSKLHFADNEKKTDQSLKDFKFSMIVDNFNKVCSRIEKEPFLSIDEQIIPYKGIKSSLRQYLPKKPKKWGYKVFALCGKMGLVHRVEFYCGKTCFEKKFDSDFGKASAVVMRLAETIPVGKFYRLYADNYFNSPKLQIASLLANIFPFHRCILRQ